MMNSTRRIAMCAVLASTFASVAALAQTADRSWHGPAAAAAEAAAASKNSGEAIVPPIAPAPVEATRPSPVETKSIETKVTAAETKPAADVAAPGKKNDAGKAKPAAAAPVAAQPAAKGADPKAKEADKGKEAKKEPPVPAKKLFGSVKTAAPLAARSIG